MPDAKVGHFWCRMVRTSAAVAAAGLMARSASAVELKFDPGLPGIAVTGDIVAGDDVRLVRFFQTAGLDIRGIALDSYGGDVMTAVAMGRAINRLGLGTVVMPGRQCNSACFFVWAAGAPRYNRLGIIGVHRPYAAYYGKADPQRFNELEAQHYAALEAYLVEMRIPRPIIDTMLATPTDSLHVLTEMELRTIPTLGVR